MRSWRNRTVSRHSTTTPRTLLNERTIAQYCKEFFGNELRYNVVDTCFESIHEVYVSQESGTWEFSEDNLKQLSYFLPCDYTTVKSIIRKTLMYLLTQNAKDKRYHAQITTLSSPSSYILIHDHLKELLRYSPLDELYYERNTPQPFE